MENTEIQEIDVKQLAEDMNSKAMTKSQVLDKYSIKDGKLRRLLKNNGYEYKQKTGKWQLKSENTSNEVEETKVTYRIPKELYQAVKLQAIFEGVNATDIIVKALNDYIPQTTKDIVKQNKK
ncbi:MAG: hypothetical protein RSD36_17455 [Terrisporobacter sp.]